MLPAPRQLQAMMTHLSAPLLSPAAACVIQHLVQMAVCASQEDTAVGSTGCRAHGHIVGGDAIVWERNNVDLVKGI